MAKGMCAMMQVTLMMAINNITVMILVILSYQGHN